MSNPADAVNARQDQLRESYVARDLARFEGSRRATAGDLQIGDMFVVPMRAEHQPEMVGELRTVKHRYDSPRRDTVIYKTSARDKSQWLEAWQPVVIL